MRLRITLTFPDEPESGQLAVLRWLLQEIVELHATAPADVQITVETEPEP